MTIATTLLEGYWKFDNISIEDSKVGLTKRNKYVSSCRNCRIDAETLTCQSQRRQNYRTTVSSGLRTSYHWCDPRWSAIF